MSCQGFHQHTGFLAMTSQLGNYSAWCPQKGDVESIWAVESLAQGRNTHILLSARHALPATWQAHVQIHGTTCRRYAGDTSRPVFWSQHSMGMPVYMHTNTCTSWRQAEGWQAQHQQRTYCLRNEISPPAAFLRDLRQVVMTDQGTG